MAIHTELRGINEIIDSIDKGQSNLNPTQIYNEGWMTRLLVKFSIEDELKFKGIDFSLISHWCSEALISSPFLPRKQKDRLAEGHTHADMAIGDFEVKFECNSEIKLKSNPSLFGIVEAKMGSNLSKGITHAKNYNQASRSLACIAHITKKYTSCEIFFAVVAPEETLKKYCIDEQIDKEPIATLNDLRGFGFFPILLVCFLMLVVFQEIFYGFRFAFIGVYREQSRCA